MIFPKSFTAKFPFDYAKKSANFARNMHMDTRVVEVTEFNFEVRCDLRGRLEAAMASKASKMPVRGNMHMDTRVVEVTKFNSEVRCDLQGRLEATVAS